MTGNGRYKEESAGSRGRYDRRGTKWRDRTNTTKWQDKIVVKDGKPRVAFRQQLNPRMTKEEIEAKRAQIGEQDELFEAEVTMNEELWALRDKVVGYLEEQVTLDDVLQEVMDNSICRYIGPWSH